MEVNEVSTCTAFDEIKKVASGPIKEVAVKVKEHLKKNPKARILIYNDRTSDLVEIDFRGTIDTVLKRLEEIEAAGESADDKKSGPGRPKLGVIAKEVTLLPTHWEWLAKQPGGASVTLRKLVEETKKKNFAKDQLRLAQESTYKFMTSMAGDYEKYEEALRALYAKDQKKFNDLISNWPKDIREHTIKLSKQAF